MNFLNFVLSLCTNSSQLEFKANPAHNNFIIAAIIYLQHLVFKEHCNFKTQ